jgi:hypothetical protein
MHTQRSPYAGATRHELGRLRAVLVIAVSAGALAAPHTAWGQPTAPRWPDPSSLRIDEEDETLGERQTFEYVVLPLRSNTHAKEPWSSDAGAIVRALGFDDAQAKSLGALLRKYDADRVAASEKFGEFQRDLRAAAPSDQPDPQRDQRYNQGWEAYKAYVDDRRGRFTASLRAMLTPEQAERWPAYERLLKRLSWMRALTSAGRRADLESVVGRVYEGRPRPEAFAPVLEGYVTEIDRIVQRLNDADKKLAGDGGSSNGGDARRAAILTSRHEISRDILKLNRDTMAKLLLAAEPADHGPLTDEFHMQSVHDGMKYHTSKAPLERVREAIENLPDITPEQRAAYEREWEAVMTKVRALRDQQYEQMIQQDDVPQRFWQVDTNAAMQRAHAEFPLRIELVQRLKPIFTPEQRDRMPACMREVRVPEPPVYEMPEERP